MSTLREEIVQFIDGNGLVCPNIPGASQRGSDNGPMFTSELMAMYEMSGQLTDSDIAYFHDHILPCLTDGLLCRAPGATDQEGPDDYYGVLNACKKLGITDIPRKILWASIKYLGFLNNGQPGKKTWQSFLVRQVQMVGAMVVASFPSLWNPLHWLARLAAFPAILVAAVSIAVSCIGVQPGDTDSRRLSWHLVQTMRDRSALCWLASLIWYKRLEKDYGQDGMKAVATIYYRDNHPFQRYWITS